MIMPRRNVGCLPEAGLALAGAAAGAYVGYLIGQEGVRAIYDGFLSMINNPYSYAHVVGPFNAARDLVIGAGTLAGMGAGGAAGLTGGNRAGRFVRNVIEYL